MKQDDYKNVPETVNTQPRKAVSITPDDANDLEKPIRAFRVKTSGNVQVLFIDDTVPVLLEGFISGDIFNLGVIKRIYATNTTATNIIGFI